MSYTGARSILDYDGQCADCAHLRSELDALTREVADLRDTRWKRLADERLALLANAARHMSTTTQGHGAERHDTLAVFAHVAEHAEKPAHVKALHAAHEAWEAGKR